MAEIFVANVVDLNDGDRHIVRTPAGAEIGVFFSGGAYYGYSNYCVHSGGPACEGILIQKVEDVIDDDRMHRGQIFADEMHFVCPWHGYEYDLKTGECIGDRSLRLRKYPVVVRDAGIYVVV